MKRQSDPQQGLYRLTLQVVAGTNADMPQPLVGAFVPVFVAAPDHETAGPTRLLRLLREQGFEFLDIADKKIHELDPRKWQSSCKRLGLSLSTISLPKKMFERINSGFLFTGPFAGYEAQRDA